MQRRKQERWAPMVVAAVVRGHTSRCIDTMVSLEGVSAPVSCAVATGATALSMVQDTRTFTEAQAASPLNSMGQGCASRTGLHWSCIEGHQEARAEAASVSPSLDCKPETRPSRIPRPSTKTKTKTKMAHAKPLKLEDTHPQPALPDPVDWGSRGASCKHVFLRKGTGNIRRCTPGLHVPSAFMSGTKRDCVPNWLNTNAPKTLIGDAGHLAQPESPPNATMTT